MAGNTMWKVALDIVLSLNPVWPIFASMVMLCASGMFAERPFTRWSPSDLPSGEMKRRIRKQSRQLLSEGLVDDIVTWVPRGYVPETREKLGRGHSLSGRM